MVGTEASHFIIHFLRLYLFLEEEGQSKIGKEMLKWEISHLLYMPQLGTKPKTQACALTKNGTSNL